MVEPTSCKRHDSTCSSVNDEKAEHSAASSTTRKLLTDMECGAYNSDSLCSPGHTSGQASEQEASSTADRRNDAEDADSDSTAEEGVSDKQPLVFTHLQVKKANILCSVGRNLRSHA